MSSCKAHGSRFGVIIGVYGETGDPGLRTLAVADTRAIRRSVLFRYFAICASAKSEAVFDNRKDRYTSEV